MSANWRIDVGRVVVFGAPSGLDAGELRALVGSAVGARLRAAEIAPIHRVAASVHVDVGRIAGGPPAVADRVARAIVGAAAGGGARG